MEVIEKYFPSLSSSQLVKYSQLKNLYSEWNKRINVISRKDIDLLGIRHVLHSLSIAKFIHFLPGTRILDVGTGGGFPGIPLAIMFPETRFTLIDSVGKKITVVNSVARTLELQNVVALKMRAEDVVDQFDFIVSRAVTKLPALIGWIENKIANSSQHGISNGLIALKGGDLQDELNLPYKVFIQPISSYFEETFFETKKIVHVCLA